MDQAYYVQFDVADQNVGLDPDGHRKGMTGPVGYWHVDDIKESLKGHRPYDSSRRSQTSLTVGNDGTACHSRSSGTSPTTATVAECSSSAML